MKRAAALAAWLVSFAASMLALVYLVGFVLNRYTFSTVDSGLQIPEREAVVIDVALLALFGVQHSGLARAWFKRAAGPVWSRTVYLLTTALVLLALFVLWEPMPRLVWSFETRWPFRLALLASGAVVTWALLSQSALSFVGFRQVWAYFRGEPRAPAPVAFSKRGPYRYSRHPMMIGTVLFLWATPEMSEGHLLLAAVWTLYILLATWWEEADLERELGAAYADYRRRVRRLV
ncbi:MAG: isoprenylcysteine carboxylmethyltransferase family protein [Acidobacteria bacterium]|nr:isoprenylcysteine carboxylmethyltransferase family protein [Acidobacteriota bacterium]